MENHFRVLAGQSGYNQGFIQHYLLKVIYPDGLTQQVQVLLGLGVLILNDGTLAFALVKEASGHTVFDEIALNAAKKLAPFSAFPSDTDLQELNITIPIVYSLSSKR